MNRTIVVIIIILVINMLVFFLYDHMLEQADASINNFMYKQQSEYYKKQYEEGQESENRILKVKHDIKNHLICLKEYAIKEDCEKLIMYIEKIMNDTSNNYLKVNSGNLVIDSILNYKLNEAEINEIGFEISLDIPKDLVVNDNDICIILGNGLDNAIEASKLIEKEKRMIEFCMKYSNGTIFISIYNHYSGKLHKVNNKIVTTKKDKLSHGIGLESMNSAVKKYNGIMRINNKETKFGVEIMLYLE